MSDAAKMEPWRADAERRDCYCATQRKPCPYHEGYGDGWDAGSDAVLAVLPPNGWEQVGVLAKDGQLHGTKNLWDGDEPVYRRVVPVVPSPEPAVMSSLSDAEPAENMNVITPVRCPTCGSDDRWYCNIEGYKHRLDDDASEQCCSDPWHRVPSTEPRSE